MAASARRIRSQASPASHPERQQETRRAAARPELHVVNSEQADSASSQDRLRSFIEWTRSHTVPVIQVGIAIAFLGATAVGSLTLRTQMAENSFDSQQTEQQIEKLQQDIQTDQTKLDSLQASLPQKAQDMGMVPQQDSVTIDLNGYQPSDGSK
ncbi:hypothetical protein [uncultured Bifidobacterium sp.]|uniref:hypothetical protein n=1 Tax=uncultured Bifidobacterium sp. TaxID=165187 RepID=UPI002624C93F|nr:hypothetical protein [uncultured Bifidobacterium sp.]